VILRILRRALTGPQAPRTSKTLRTERPARKRLEVESLEARLPPNCPLGQDWAFDLDHGTYFNNVYASEGWH